VLSDVFRRLPPVLLLLAVFGVAAPASKVERIGALTSASVSGALRNSLEKSGYRVFQDDGSVLCEIWLRNGMPIGQKKDNAAAIYTDFAESTLAGVISFPKATTDYRGQAVKPGTYTLRYELHPNDGNHLGVSPYRDFLLLVFPSDDPDPNAQFKFEDLVNLSRKVSGTTHPAPLSLVAPEAREYPSVFRDDQEHTIFAAKLKTERGEVPIALVIKGKAAQ